MNPPTAQKTEKKRRDKWRLRFKQDGKWYVSSMSPFKSPAAAREHVALVGEREYEICRIPARPAKATPKKAGAAKADPIKEWNRGYFCAVATFLKENFAVGAAGTEGASLFRQGGNWRVADREDIRTFQRHGLITEEAANYAIGITAAKGNK